MDNQQKVNYQLCGRKLSLTQFDKYVLAEIDKNSLLQQLKQSWVFI